MRDMGTWRISRSVNICDYSSRKHSRNSVPHYTPLECWIFSFPVAGEMCVASSNSSPAFPTIASIHPHRARHAQPPGYQFVVCRQYLLLSHFRNHQSRKTVFQCTGKSCNCITEMNILANTTKTKISWWCYSSRWHIWMSQLSPSLTLTYEGWNFNSGNYLFTTDTK